MTKFIEIDKLYRRDIQPLLRLSAEIITNYWKLRLRRLGMTDIPGVETIRNLVGEPPPKIEVPYKLMSKEETLRPAWNHCFIAILPFCYKCKVPLVWHSAPREEGHEDELFTCPNCGRVWVKGEGW